MSSKRTKRKSKPVYFYAVFYGRKTGIFKNWASCKPHVKDFKGAKYKKFLSLQAAQEYYVNGTVNRAFVDKTDTPSEQSKITNFFKKQK